MPKLKQITQIINDRLMASPFKGRNFQRGQFYTLATTVVNSEGNSIPVLEGAGVEIDLTITDKYPFFLYHRNTTSAFSNSDFGNINTVYNMTAVIFYDNSVFQVIPQDMAYMFASIVTGAFTPSELGQAGLSSVVMQALNANTDTQRVFENEYPNYLYQFDQNKRMISINYSITVNAKLSCVSCENC